MYITTHLHYHLQYHYSPSGQESLPSPVVVSPGVPSTYSGTQKSSHMQATRCHPVDLAPLTFSSGAVRTFSHGHDVEGDGSHHHGDHDGVVPHQTLLVVVDRLLLAGTELLGGDRLFRRHQRAGEVSLPASSSSGPPSSDPLPARGSPRRRLTRRAGRPIDCVPRARRITMATIVQSCSDHGDDRMLRRVSMSTDRAESIHRRFCQAGLA